MLTRKHRRGFTLIELMVAVSLMVILISGVVYIFFHSTQMFSMAEGLMKIFQNARAAFGIMGREISGCYSLESGQQWFKLANPPGGGAVTWKPDPIDGTRSGQVSDPFVVMISQSSWLDGSKGPPSKLVVGPTKIHYRLRRDPGPVSASTITVTLERVLLQPTVDDITSYLIGEDGTTQLKIFEDLCQFVRYDPAATRAFFSLQFFNSATGEFEDAPTIAERFHAGNANVKYQKLPGVIRINMQIVDDNLRRVRTIVQEFLIPTARY